MTKRRRQSAPSWGTIQEMEQIRWIRWVHEHADDDPLCRELAARCTITQTEAALLARVARQHDWKLPSVGQAAAERRRT